MLFRLSFVSALLFMFACAASARASDEPAAISYADVGLEQIMADPDWIAPRWRIPAGCWTAAVCCSSGC